MRQANKTSTVPNALLHLGHFFIKKEIQRTKDRLTLSENDMTAAIKSNEIYKRFFNKKSPVQKSSARVIFARKAEKTLGRVSRILFLVRR